MEIDMRMKIGNIELEWPVIPASGVWPYEEDFWKAERLAGIGAICTKAISLRSRSGNKGVRLWETPAGVLNSIGLQNVGATGFVEKYLKMTKTCPVPVIDNVGIWHWLAVATAEYLGFQTDQDRIIVDARLLSP